MDDELDEDDAEGEEWAGSGLRETTTVGILPVEIVDVAVRLGSPEDRVDDDPLASSTMTRACSGELE